MFGKDKDTAKVEPKKAEKKKSSKIVSVTLLLPNYVCGGVEYLKGDVMSVPEGKAAQMRIHGIAK